MRSQRRDAASAARQRPMAPHRVTIPALGDGSCGPADGGKPSDLFLETTDSAGEVAVWLDDAWWMEALGRWGGSALVVHILPSRAALLHPVVLHQVAMISRVAPNWRVIGYGYAGEISGDEAIESLGSSAYHEVRFVEGARPDARGTAASAHALRIEDLFSRVRRFERQRGTTRPVLSRAKSLPPVPGDASGQQVASGADQAQALRGRPQRSIPKGRT